MTMDKPTECPACGGKVISDLRNGTIYFECQNLAIDTGTGAYQFGSSCRRAYDVAVQRDIQIKGLQAMREADHERIALLTAAARPLHEPCPVCGRVDDNHLHDVNHAAAQPTQDLDAKAKEVTAKLEGLQGPDKWQIVRNALAQAGAQPTQASGGWRLLEVGEVIQEGDEIFLDFWKKSLIAGEKVTRGVFRRRIASPAPSECECCKHQHGISSHFFAVCCGLCKHPIVNPKGERMYASFGQVDAWQRGETQPAPGDVGALVDKVINFYNLCQSQGVVCHKHKDEVIRDVDCPECQKEFDKWWKYDDEVRAALKELSEARAALAALKDGE